MPELADISSLREELLNEAEVVSEEAVEEDTLSKEAIDSEGEEAEAEAESEAVEYFNELPDAMGWQPEDFYKLKLKTDAGEVYTWSEVKDSLQQTKAQREELAAKETALLAKEQAIYQQRQQVAPISQEVAAAQSNVTAISQAYNQVMAGMQQLEQDSDTDGLVRAQSELLRLNGLYGQAQQQLQQAQEQQQLTQQQGFIQHRAQQAKLLADKLPVFGEAESRKTAANELKTYLLGEGATEQEVSGLVDARTVSLFYKAMLYDKHQKEVKKTSQALRDGTIKRIIKGKHVKAVPSRERNAKVIERAIGSHRESDKRAAFRAVAEDAGILKLGGS